MPTPARGRRAEAAPADRRSAGRRRAGTRRAAPTARRAGRKGGRRSSASDDRLRTRGDRTVNPLSDPQLQQTLKGVFRLVVPEIALVGDGVRRVPVRLPRTTAAGCGSSSRSLGVGRRGDPRRRREDRDAAGRSTAAPIVPDGDRRVRPLGGAHRRGRAAVRVVGRGDRDDTPPSTTAACSSPPPACRWSAGRTTSSRCSSPSNSSASRPTSCSTCRRRTRLEPGGGGQVLPAERDVVGRAAVRVQLPLRPDRHARTSRRSPTR